MSNHFVSMHIDVYFLFTHSAINEISDCYLVIDFNKGEQLTHAPFL